jgi:hypothetical protein
MTRFWVAAALLALMLSSASIAALGVGVALSQSPAPLTDLDACRLPCWKGITPGLTSLVDAQTMLSARGYTVADGRFLNGRLEYSPPPESRECAVVLGSLNDRIVSYVHLTQCGDSRLGDIALLLNRAEGTTSGYLLGWGPTYRQRSVTLLTFGRSDLSPYSRNFFILLTSPNDAGAFPWMGFVSWQQFCQRQPIACRASGPIPH